MPRYQLVVDFDRRLPKAEQAEAPEAETVDSPTALQAAIARQIYDPRFGSLHVEKLEDEDDLPAAA